VRSAESGLAHVRLEQEGVGHAVDHERCEHVARVKQQQIAGISKCVNVEMSRSELHQHRVQVRRRRDDEARLAKSKALAEKVGHRPAQRRLVLVKSNGMEVPRRVGARCSRSLHVSRIAVRKAIRQASPHQLVHAMARPS
jgi:hypothetical protein